MTSLLAVDDVSVSFGGLQALDSVSLDVGTRSIVGLIGPNGAGKTTLFNVMSGLQQVDRGTVMFDGNEIGGLAVHARARLGIGRSFQNLGLIGDETVAVNLLAAQHVTSGYHAHDALVRPWRWRRAEAQMRERATAAAVAVNVDHLLDVRIDDLSFGKARFVELACILSQGPRMMLLDEPTTGLDVTEVGVLLDLLRAERSRGTTILLVAHDVRFVMSLCDHVYVLAEGRLLADGAPSAVQQHPAVIEAYLGRSA